MPTKYWNVMVVVDGKHAKRHTMRVGSAALIKDDVITCDIETIPVSLNQDGVLRLRLTPVVTEEQQ